ncbi:hypothetical protein V6N13_051893 [Hibiscus sabdariffa]
MKVKPNQLGKTTLLAGRTALDLTCIYCYKDWVRLCRPVSPIKTARSSLSPVDTISSSPNCDIVGRWDESLDDFNEDEENIVPVSEDDDVHLLDVDDVEAVMTDASEENGLDVEDDVWSVAVARLELGNDKPIWGYVGQETKQSVPSYPAYEPPASMYDVDYTAM